VSEGETPARITPAVVAKVARLARLGLDDGEIDAMTAQIAGMLDHFRDIDRLELDEVEPLAQPLPLTNVMRDDTVGGCLDRDEVLAAAPASEDGRFRVPPTIGFVE
jgi:aspartyl-tRNA(Asn)/glutamyl-tRNA(Gln) amidotransferase subunit C